MCILNFMTYINDNNHIFNSIKVKKYINKNKIILLSLDLNG